MATHLKAPRRWYASARAGTGSTGFLDLARELTQKILLHVADTAREAPTALFSLARTCEQISEELKVRLWGLLIVCASKLLTGCLGQ